MIGHSCKPKVGCLTPKGLVGGEQEPVVVEQLTYFVKNGMQPQMQQSSAVTTKDRRALMINSIVSGDNVDNEWVFTNVDV